VPDLDAPRHVKSARLKIGMEIHVELATRSKMFSRAPNVAHPDFYDAAPNTLIDPVVLGLPGALPVMNRQAVEMAMMVGLALGCEIARFSKWDRKNYFYPDLPKGYQISQYDLPLCTGGSLSIAAETGPPREVRLVRAHLEEDTGKLSHELPGGLPYEGSLIDFNRAGTPLLEIVTQPDITSADEAVAFARELRNICRFLGVTEGVMQRGHMRFEPNVNVIITTGDGREVATPIVEVKNLNSFRAVKGAIEHEFTRQVEAWKADGRVMGPGAKRTRGWDDARGITVLQREKEDAHDYRYFPDPDLLPVVVNDAWREEMRARMPELPAQRRRRFESQLGVAAKDALTLTENRDLCSYFESCAAIAGDRHASAVAKLLLNNLAKRANDLGRELHDLGIHPGQVAEIVTMREEGAIGSAAVDRLLESLAGTGNAPRDAAARLGLLQIADAGQLDAWIAQAIADQPQAAQDFAAGKDAALGRLVGAVMKASGGKADATATQQLLRDRLRST
jgi:aspartyl-tRNA(Asn)/glutamyl-tRNA(Gln) amidotransferase subunit B